MGLILNNPVEFTESSIWNSLIPSRPELPHDINDYDDNENEDNDDEEEDLSPMLVESEETDYTS